MITTLAVAMAIYVIAIFVLSFVVRGRIHSDEDFIVAGRRLPFSLAMPTLLATWFGAGTLLVAADEVRSEGLRVTAMEPFGSGLCLLLAGLFFARRLWEARILTIVDLFRQHYGRTAEVLATAYNVSFFAWVATQLIAMANILELFFGIDTVWGVLLVGGVSMAYTLLGGMWSVTVTDAVQMLLLAVGLVILTASILHELGTGDWAEGVARIVRESDEASLVVIPRETTREFFEWLSLFIVGTIGILPGQDLLQRVFSSKSSRVAVSACLVAGLVYIVLGCLPVLLGMAGRLFPEAEVGNPVIPALADRFLSEPLKIVFVLTLLSAVMSSIDSGILAPSSIFSHNLLRPWVRGRVSDLALTRLSVVAVSAVSMALALSGHRAFALLEGSYSILLPPLVVMVFAVWTRRRSPAAGVATLAVGLGVWILEAIWEAVIESRVGRDLDDLIGLPLPLVVLAVAVIVYLVTDTIARRGGPRAPEEC